jgi:RimJ/RimL family protein N-acetyltransferase
MQRGQEQAVADLRPGEQGGGDPERGAHGAAWWHARARTRHTDRVMRHPQPTLSDGRLTLRPPGPDDVAAITAACQDPEIARWTRVPRPYTEAQARAWLQSENEGVRLLVFDREDRLVGNVGLMELETRPGYGEIGYWTAAAARRQGVASGAVVLLRDWAAAELGLTLIEILIHRDNTPSHGVPLRAGFRATGELREPPARMESDEGPVFVVYAWRSDS